MTGRVRPRSLVLVGPMGAGKSTVGRLLAPRLGLRYVPLDAIRWYYHLTDGFDLAAPPPPGGFQAIVRGWEPHSIRAVERALAEFPDALHDFGAGHAHFSDPDHVARLRAALGDRPVVLLLPSADPERSVRICCERDRARLGPAWDPTRDDMNAAFVHSATFRAVATLTVHAEDRGAEAVADEIVARLG